MAYATGRSGTSQGEQRCEETAVGCEAVKAAQAVRAYICTSRSVLRDDRAKRTEPKKNRPSER